MYTCTLTELWVCLYMYVCTMYRQTDFYMLFHPFALHLCLQVPGGKACPTRRSSLTMRSRPGWAGSTWSATLTTSTNPGPNAPALLRDGGWEWASTRPWWRAGGRSREQPTRTGENRRAHAHSSHNFKIMPDFVPGRQHWQFTPLTSICSAPPHIIANACSAQSSLFICEGGEVRSWAAFQLVLDN